MLIVLLSTTVERLEPRLLKLTTSQKKSVVHCSGLWKGQQDFTLASKMHFPLSLTICKWISWPLSANLALNSQLWKLLWSPQLNFFFFLASKIKAANPPQQNSKNKTRLWVCRWLNEKTLLKLLLKKIKPDSFY